MLRATIAALFFAYASVGALHLQPRAAPTRRGSDVRCSLAVFGATGQLGSECVYQALARGEKVVALARTPSKLVVPEGSGGTEAGAPLTSRDLTVLEGSVTSRADVDAVFATGGITGVVVALGGKTKDVGPTMLQDGTANIIAACEAAGVKRISIVTSIGAGDSENQAPFFFKVLMMTVMSGIFKDKNAQEALFLNGPGRELEWTIVRPGGLSTAPPNGIINVIQGEAGSIARADVAAFCLDAATKPDWQYLRQTPCISSDKGTSWVKDKGMTVGGKVVK